jgi:hypothetical protein
VAGKCGLSVKKNKRNVAKGAKEAHRLFVNPFREGSDVNADSYLLLL